MKESLLHYIWRSALFDHRDLRSTCGQEIFVYDPGEYNLNSGPDFQNAKIRIGSTTWAGNVEIHLRSSNWFEHGHQSDPAYQNTILHVVYEHDTDAPLIAGNPVPTLELRERFDDSLQSRQELFEGSSDGIACASSLARANTETAKVFLHTVAEERLAEKSIHIESLLNESRNSWEQVLFVLLCRHFGMLINRQPFEMLARSLSWKLLQRLKAGDMEALLIGQAGLLQSSFRDEYPRLLRERYQYLAHKHSLQPIDVSLWKLMRMRPSGFPAMRLSQLAALLSCQSHLFSKVLQLSSLAEASQLLSVSASTYWESHYRFDEKSPRHGTGLGKEAIELLIINVIAPMLFTYGKLRQSAELRNRAISFLMQLPAENNRISRAYSKLGLSARNAFESQGMLYLKKNYCERRNCLNCGIGIGLFRSLL